MCDAMFTFLILDVMSQHFLLSHLNTGQNTPVSPQTKLINMNVYQITLRL